MPHAEALELAPLAALGVLDGADWSAFDSHLREGCAECEASVALWRRDLSLLAFSVPEAEPPPGLRGRILGAAGRTTRLSKPTRPTGRRGWLALAASLLLAVAVADDLAQRRSVRETQRRAATLSVQLQRNRVDLARKELRVRFIEDPDVQTILLSGLPASPGSRGRILFSAKARRAILVAANLPALEPGRQYELWFIAGGKPIAAGTFDSRAEAPIVFESTPLPEGVSSVEKFAVTIEPRGGVSQPTGPMVLLGSA